MSDLGAPPPRPTTARLTAPPLAALRDLTRPRAVAVSFWCWLVASLVVGATMALASTKLDTMRAEFARLAGSRDPSATEATIDRVAAASVLIVIGTGAVLGLLSLMLAGVMRAGRNWARVILAVLALVAVVYAGYLAMVVTGEMIGALRGAVGAGLLAYTALVAVAAVSMFLPGTKPWFHRPKGI